MDPVNPIEIQESRPLQNNDNSVSFDQSLYNEIQASAFDKPDFDPEESDDETECVEQSDHSTMEREEESELIEACKALGNFQEANLLDQLTCQPEATPAEVLVPDEGAEILSYWPLETLSKDESDLGILPFLTNGMDDLFFGKTLINKIFLH